VLYSTVKYDGTTGTGTDILKIVKEEEMGIQTVIFLAVLISTGAAISIYALSTYAVPKSKSYIEKLQIRIKVSKIVEKRKKQSK
jgi:hypothetical protein